jgi:hypothetical protein
LFQETVHQYVLCIVVACSEVVDVPLQLMRQSSQYRFYNHARGAITSKMSSLWNFKIYLSHKKRVCRKKYEQMQNYASSSLLSENFLTRHVRGGNNILKEFGRLLKFVSGFPGTPSGEVKWSTS